MSLRLRLLLLITVMVALSVIVLSALQLQALLNTRLEHTNERASSAAQIVKTYVLQRSEEYSGVGDVFAVWRKGLSEDRNLPPLLAEALAPTGSIVEISVAGERGRVLASSNPNGLGAALASRTPLQSLLRLGPVDKWLALAGGGVDYEHRVELGVAGRAEPVFTIQVLVSSVLLRAAVLPALKDAALFSLLALVVGTLTAFVAARIALRPLAGIGRDIDRITQGAMSEAPALSSTQEFAVVQQKLRLLGEQFQGASQLIERLEEAVLLFDASSRLLLCGEPAERMLKRPRRELIGRQLEELLPGLVPLVNTGQPARDQLIDDHLVSLDFLPQGGLLLRIRDPEGRRLLESELNISTRLAAINKLTGRVAHEIKNPLNSIALRLELLKNQVLPEIPEAREEIQIIAQEITRLDRVVRTFLDFTRPVELKSQEIDMVALVRETLELVTPEAEQSGVRVKADERALMLPVCGDEGLLKQLLLNIVRNALDAMPGGGALDVALRSEDGSAVVDIADTGPGVPLEAREKIFQLYYSTKEKGSGIGLAMTFRAVQLHGGSIEVGDGNGGKGALFRLKLPLYVGGGCR